MTTKLDTENKILWAARENPESLMHLLISQKGSEVMLSIAAEEAGRCIWPEITPVLRSLTEHKSSIVREGAVYGLSHQLDQGLDLTIAGTLLHLSTEDSSSEVREAAKEALSV